MMADSPATPIVNAMTVDVEDYYQVSAFESVVDRSKWDSYESRVEANTERVLGILAEFGVRATFFVLGWEAERRPALVRRIAASGHEVASHGFGHRLVYDQTPAEFREDVRTSKRLLEDAIGRPVFGYRAPSFSITKRSLWALDVLIEEGYAWDASVFPIHHDRYGIPDAPRHPFRVPHGVGQIAVDQAGRGLSAALVESSVTGGPGQTGSHLLEIPASTIRFAGQNVPVAGGGYFRLLPYRWTTFGIRRLNRSEGRPAIFYLHPWETDPGQPRLAAGRLSRFRHYRNLRLTGQRLRRLLGEHRFGTVGEVFDPGASRRPTAVGGQSDTAVRLA